MQDPVRKKEAIWHPDRAFFISRAPSRLRPWLIDKESLTKHLINHCQGHFTVQVHRQYWQRPFYSEARLLGMSCTQLAFIREVHLLCDAEPWVFARTVIPLATLHGELQKLTQLGSRPLGAVLFANPAIRRGKMEVAHFKSWHYMYNIAAREPQTEPLWGRRSLFYMNNKPLLVNELFLEKLPAKYL